MEVKSFCKMCLKPQISKNIAKIRNNFTMEKMKLKKVRI